MKTGPRLFLATFALLSLFAAVVGAQDVPLHVTYVCDGEKIFVDSCNIRDTSDTANCMIGHPDKVQANGIMAYTYQTRGALKKLLPTCKQPSKDEVARTKAFDKKVADAQAANEKKANDENDAIEARAQQAQQAMSGKKPQTADQRAMNRCITAGRVPAVCMGNSLSKGFADMLNAFIQVTPKPAEPGLTMAGSFAGAGNWRIEFEDDQAAMGCSDLVPSGKAYTIELKNSQAIVKVDSSPKPLVLAMKADGTLVGAGPIVVHGSIVSGTTGGGSYSAGTPGGYTTSQQTTTTSMSPAEAQSHAYDGGTFTENGQMVDHTTTSTVNTYNAGTPASYSGPTVTYAPATRSCSAPVLSSKHAGAGGTDTAKSFATALFNDGDSGPPVPAGMRMHGTYGGEGGISVEFYPESAIIACGDAARAYPYSVRAEGANAVIRVEEPTHPLVLTLQSGGELTSAASGAYLVHGRKIVGQDDDGNFRFAPLEATCNLSALKAGVEAAAHAAVAAPAASAASSSAAGSAAAASSATARAVNPGGLKTAVVNQPTGNAVLSLTSGFATPAGAQNPTAGVSLILLRDSLATLIAKAGLAIPAGSSAPKVVATTCAAKSADCQKLIDAIHASSASLARADAKGGGDMPGVPAGKYYLMISAHVGKQVLFWGFGVELKAGANKLTLSEANGTPVN